MKAHTTNGSSIYAIQRYHWASDYWFGVILYLGEPLSYVPLLLPIASHLEAVFLHLNLSIKLMLARTSYLVLRPWKILDHPWSHFTILLFDAGCQEAMFSELSMIQSPCPA